MSELKSRRHPVTDDINNALRELWESFILSMFNPIYRWGMGKRTAGGAAQTAAIVARQMTDGIARDCTILSNQLEEMGYEVATYEENARSYLDLIRHRRIADIILHLESIHRVWLTAGTRNLVVPNQEWIFRDNARYFRYVDYVLSKTHHAESLFMEAGIPTGFIGFSTPDRRLESHEQPVDHKRFLHVAGKSTLKGTSNLIEVWKHHPEWPELIVCTRLPKHFEGVNTPNITFRTGFIDDADLQSLQNQIRNHVCTSASEGFGHYIMEALSIGAITLFTNAPPMNDLVGQDNGIPVDISDARSRGQGMDFFIDTKDLERKIEQAISLPPNQRQALSANARRRYETVCTDFAKRFPRIFRAALNSGT